MKLIHFVHCADSLLSFLLLSNSLLYGNTNLSDWQLMNFGVVSSLELKTGTVNICMPVFACTCFNFCQINIRREIFGSYDQCMSILLRNCQAGFHSG